MNKRQAQFTEWEAGAFSITCESCPLLPHLKALDQSPVSCLSGIITNVQGPVVLNTCKHLEKDSLANGEGKTLSILCTKEGES